MGLLKVLSINHEQGNNILKADGDGASNLESKNGDDGGFYSPP